MIAFNADRTGGGQSKFAIFIVIGFDLANTGKVPAYFAANLFHHLNSLLYNYLAGKGGSSRQSRNLGTLFFPLGCLWKFKQAHIQPNSPCADHCPARNPFFFNWFKPVLIKVFMVLDYL